MASFLRILSTFFIAILLSGCAGDEDNAFSETEQVYPSEVTYQFINADISAHEIQVSLVGYYSTKRIYIDGRRVSVSDGFTATSEVSQVYDVYRETACEESYTGYDPVFGNQYTENCPQPSRYDGDQPTPQGEGKLIYQLKPANTDYYQFPLSLMLTTETQLWNSLTSSADIAMLPEITSPGSNSSTNDSVHLYWNLPPESLAVSIAYAGCDTGTNYFQSLHFNQLSFIELAAGTTEYELDLSDLATASVPEGCEISFWVISKAEGDISPDFAGGEFIVNRISDPVSVVSQH